MFQSQTHLIIIMNQVHCTRVLLTKLVRTIHFLSNWMRVYETPILTVLRLQRFNSHNWLNYILICQVKISKIVRLNNYVVSILPSGYVWVTAKIISTALRCRVTCKEVAFILAYRCGGLVVRESSPHAEGPAFESQRRCYHSHLMVQTTSPYELDFRSL